MSRHDRGRRKSVSRRGGTTYRKKSYARGNAPLRSDSLKGKKSSFVDSEKSPKQEELIRLNKYIANSGICSRREADTYIRTGLVTVNGKVINEMGYRVRRTDDVRFDGRRINPEPDTYILLNKPKGFATTDSRAKGKTVYDLIANATAAKVKPFGRLGRNATGVLLFTNDDEFVQKFSKKGLSRMYHIELDKNLKPEHLQKIEEGITIDNRTIEVEAINYVDNAPKSEVGLKIKHMGNSVIRTIFEHLGYEVIKTDCVTLGPLTKKDLPRGRYRILTPKEQDLFKML